MSRTFRRKNVPVPNFIKTEYTRLYSDPYVYTYFDGYKTVVYEYYRSVRIRIPRDMSTREAKFDVARYYSDKRNQAKGGWKGENLNLFIQGPYRVEAKRQLHNFKRNDDYEVILRSKPKKGYWD